MVQGYHHLLHRHPGSLSSYEWALFGPQTVVPDEMVKTPHGSISSPFKPLSPFCSQCLVGSRLESTHQPRARHEFREASFQPFICSLSSLSIYLFRLLFSCFIVSCLGRNVPSEFLRVQTRGICTASATPDEHQTREQHNGLGRST